MKFKVNNLATVLLTTFVVFAAVGFASPIVATTLPGSNIATSKITVGDDTQVFAIADTNYLQGGHMQVPDLASMYAITSQRRSLGMLVTVIDTDAGTPGNQTVMYRLTSNPHGTDVPCGIGTSYVTDGSLDGKDYPAVCQSTTADNWTAFATGGSVTSFSSGDLSPLFTTTVSTATSTPALSFTLSSQVANTFFAGPVTGSDAAPTFRSMVFADLPQMDSGNILVGTGIGSSVASVTVSGDATLSSSGALTIADNAVTYAKIQQVNAFTLLGNPTGSTANAQEITLGAGLALDGTSLVNTSSGSVISFSSGDLSPLFTTTVSTSDTTPALSFTLSTHTANTFFAGPTVGSDDVPTFRTMVLADLPQMDDGTILVGTGVGSSVASVAVSGDATLASSGVLTIADNAVTYAKIQQVNAFTLLGNPTGSTANAQEITLGAGLALDGTSLINTSAFAVGASLAGGTPDEVLYTDGSGSLAQTSDFLYSVGSGLFRVGFGGQANLNIDPTNSAYQIGNFQNSAIDGTNSSLSLTGNTTTYAFTSGGLTPIDTNSVVGIASAFVFKDVAGNNVLHATDGSVAIGNTTYGSGGVLNLTDTTLSYATSVGTALTVNTSTNTAGLNSDTLEAAWDVHSKYVGDILKLRSDIGDSTVFSVGENGALFAKDASLGNTFLSFDPATNLYEFGGFNVGDSNIIVDGVVRRTTVTSETLQVATDAGLGLNVDNSTGTYAIGDITGGGGGSGAHFGLYNVTTTGWNASISDTVGTYLSISPSTHFFSFGDSAISGNQLVIGDDTTYSGVTDAVIARSNRIFGVEDTTGTHPVLYTDTYKDQYTLGDVDGFYGGATFLQINGSNGTAGFNTISSVSALDVQNSASISFAQYTDTYATDYTGVTAYPITVSGSYAGMAQEVTVMADHVALMIDPSTGYSGGTLAVGDHLTDLMSSASGTIESITTGGACDSVLVKYDSSSQTHPFFADTSMGTTPTVTNGTVTGAVHCGALPYVSTSEDGSTPSAPAAMDSITPVALGSTGLTALFDSATIANVRANARWVIHTGARYNITRFLSSYTKSDQFSIADNGRTSIHNQYGGLTGLFDGANGAYGIGDLSSTGSGTSLYIDDTVQRILAKGALDVQPLSSTTAATTIEYYGDLHPDPVTLVGTYATPATQSIIAIKFNYRHFSALVTDFVYAQPGDHITASSGLHAAGVITSIVPSTLSGYYDVTVVMDGNSPKDYLTGAMTDDTASFSFTPINNTIGFTYSINNGASSSPVYITYGIPDSLGSTGLSVAFSDAPHSNDVWVIRAGMTTDLQVGSTKRSTQFSVTDAGTFSLYNLAGGRGAVFDSNSDYYGIGDVDSTRGGSNLIVDSLNKKITANVNYNNVFSIDGTANTYSFGSNGFGNNTYLSINDTAKTASITMGDGLTGLTPLPVLDLALNNHYSLGTPFDNSHFSLDEIAHVTSIQTPDFKVGSTGIAFSLNTLFEVNGTVGGTYSLPYIQGNTYIFALGGSSIGNYTYFDSYNGGSGGIYKIGDFSTTLAGGHDTSIVIDDTSAHKVSVAGDLYVVGSVSSCTLGTATGGVSCSSDARLKTNVQDLPSAIDQIAKLRPVTFTWIDPSKPQGTNIGFIAQEVKEVFPQFVTQNGDYYGVDYAGLITPTIKAVQELNLKVDLAMSLDPAREGSLATLIRTFLENALNGIQSIFVNRVNTKQLCLDDVCVTRDQLQKVLNQANVQSALPATDTTTPATSPVTPTTGTSNPTSTTTIDATAPVSPTTTDTSIPATTPVAPVDPVVPTTDATTSPIVPPTTPSITPPADAQSVTVTQ